MKTNKTTSFGRICSCVMLLLLAHSKTAAAMDILVYTNADSGNGSLRQAIQDNAALGAGNTIIFSNVVTGAITLTNGELLISENLTILGPGPASLAVNGNAASRVFHITNAVTA